MKGKGAARSASIVMALVLSMVLTASAPSCGGEQEAGEKIGVVVTLPPQAEFVEEVGGEKVDVTIMVPPGASPHTYEPTPSQMAALSRAAIYAKVGSEVEFELAWMDRLTQQNPDMMVLDCSRGVQLMETAGADEPEGASHEHGALDPHIWMSPLSAQIMVQNICDGLVQVDPEDRAYYEANRDAYLEQLGQLDQDMAQGLAQVTNRVFMVYHPFMGYLARDYDLTMLPIEEEGKEPTAADLARLIDQAKEHNIRVIFVSPQSNPESAEVIADQIDGRVVSIDPLARDYIANLRLILGELVQAME